MSGDVQPRKRKDKKRKRDSLDRKSEGEILITRKASLDAEEDEVIHHGVHATKMGTDDVHLHVQAEHDTGGNWFAKIFFFSLLAILVGLIGLIILENRGLSDLDTPLSESKYKDYFEGWVDEHRQSHDDHHDVVAHEIEEHDEHDEPFEEEEDHDDEDEDEHDEVDDEENETAENDSENDENDTEENDKDDDEDEDDNDNDDDNDDDEEEEDIIVKKTSQQTHKDNSKNVIDDKDDDDDDDDDDDNDNDDDNENNDDDDDEDENITDENDDDDEKDDNDDENDEKNQDDENDEDDDSNEKEKAKSDLKNKGTDDPDDPFEEEEYDGTFESLENSVVDNDAEELRLLQEKANLAKKNEKAKLEQETESASSSIMVKIGVGLALAYVARLVIIKKGPDDSKSADDLEPNSEILMQRRLTIAPDDIPFDNNEDELIYDEEDDEEVIASSENGDIEDEEYIEEIEIEIEDDQDEEPENNLSSTIKYSPETFEQLNAMFHSTNKTPQNMVDLTKNIIEPILMKNEANILPTKISTDSMTTSHNARENISTVLQKSEPLATVQQNESGDEIDELDEELDDEMIEEEDEEDISDIDDSDLMKRLDEKYGKIPDREYESEDMEEEEIEIDDVDDADDNSWTKIKRSGAQYYHDNQDDNIDDELNKANDEMFQNNFEAALRIYADAFNKNPNNPKVFYGKAKTLEKLSEIHKSEEYLKDSIEAYKRVLSFHDIIDDDMFKDSGINCIQKMIFMGLYNQAIHIHELLIAKFNDEPQFQNELAVTFLLSDRLHEAKLILEKIIKRWPDDGYAQVNYGYVLANLDENLIEGIKYLEMGIESDAEGTQDGRFYMTLGEALHKIGRVDESRQIFKKGASRKIFLSEYQRSLYNIDSLKSKPFWSKINTTYENFFAILENNWEKIREEGFNALNEKGYFIDEAKNLINHGDWKQFDLFNKGIKYSKNCLKAPITCKLIESFPAARFCKRGQTKFSVMHPNTHIWPHCGPTNCRLRSHLGLIVPSNTWIRVANETIRSWEEGKVLIFDDSFEHEVWHNGTSLRLVLIVDFWHPDLTESQRNQLLAL